jgi:putative sigma-54 modulation protein
MANVNVQARNCEVDNEVQSHFEEKLEDLERMWPNADEALVRVSFERGRYSAEITLVSGGMITRSEERAGNLRQAFDNALEKLEGQLRRYKKKLQARARRHDNRDDVAGTVMNATLPSGGVVSAVTPGGMALAGDAAAHAPSANFGANSGEDVEDDDGQMVRIKRFALKPMSAEEASLQMGLLGHSFFVFRDAESDQISVVYRRRDGGYGLIEPVSD